MVLHFLVYINKLPDVICNITVILMILLSTLTVIRRLICDCNQSWLLNLNLTCKTQQFGAVSGLLISALEKLNLFRLTSLLTLLPLRWKWMGLFFKKNHLLRCWESFSLLNWIMALTLALLQLPPRRLEL